MANRSKEIRETVRERYTAAVVVTLALALLPAAPALAGTVRIDGPRNSFLSEPEIAVDPSDPSRLLVVSKDGFALNAYRSSDGGASFAGGRVIAGSYLGAPALATDPVALFDGDGTAFFGQLVSRSSSRTRSQGVVGVMRSDDGGASFATPVAVVREPYRRKGDDFGPFDKEWFAVDRTGGARGGALYAAWVRTKRGPSSTNTIRVSSSLDGGDSWARPLRISSRHRYALGPQVAVLPNGSVHLAWASFRRHEGERTGAVLHARSRDGGRSFTPPRRIARFRNGLAAYPLVGLAASPARPRLLACWASGGKRRSRAVCARWQRGHGWRPPHAVAPRARGEHDLVAVAAQGRRRFWVSLYAERPRGGTRVLLRRSEDGGRSFSHERVLGRRPYRLRSFVGDYTGLEAQGGRVFAAYVLPSRGPFSPHAIYVTSRRAP